VFLLASRSLLL